ncbi:MAG: hypothetical protein HRU76_11820 [Phycisphaeraceae bacterium]|nr:hypothetical protein [Phycisphaerales bacterium]QOJ16076.1 MAG: hypothetical protein HRU76_11820 [Phycisphaeraceae bacterium]
MRDPEDIVEIEGVSSPGSRAGERSVRAPGSRSRRPWLSIWFQCCHVYGRIYRNDAATAYEGRCPRCAAAVRARIGPDGTNQRLFRAM